MANKKKRVNASFDQGWLKGFDRYAKKKGWTRSTFLERAGIEYMRTHPEKVAQDNGE